MCWEKKQRYRSSHPLLFPHNIERGGIFMGNYRVYVYAICKNERAFAARWMQSMREADGVYVLDTGSTDGTPEGACAQMGVTASSRASGISTGPPADRLYAVEPVGVLTISPSPCRRMAS